jgi:hypothetical protein
MCWCVSLNGSLGVGLSLSSELSFSTVVIGNQFNPQPVDIGS